MKTYHVTVGYNPGTATEPNRYVAIIRDERFQAVNGRIDNVLDKAWREMARRAKGRFRVTTTGLDLLPKDQEDLDARTMAHNFLMGE